MFTNGKNRPQLPGAGGSKKVDRLVHLILLNISVIPFAPNHRTIFVNVVNITDCRIIGLLLIYFRPLHFLTSLLGCFPFFLYILYHILTNLSIGFFKLICKRFMNPGARWAYAQPRSFFICSYCSAFSRSIFSLS